MTDSGYPDSPDELLDELLDELGRTFAAGTFDASDLAVVWEMSEWLDEADLDPIIRARIEPVVPAWATMLARRGIADRGYGPASRQLA